MSFFGYGERFKYSNNATPGPGQYNLDSKTSNGSVGSLQGISERESLKSAQSQGTMKGTAIEISPPKHKRRNSAVNPALNSRIPRPPFSHNNNRSMDATMANMQQSSTSAFAGESARVEELQRQLQAKQQQLEEAERLLLSARHEVGNQRQLLSAKDEDMKKLHTEATTEMRKLHSDLARANERHQRDTDEMAKLRQQGSELQEQVQQMKMEKAQALRQFTQGSHQFKSAHEETQRLREIVKAHEATVQQLQRNMAEAQQAAEQQVSQAKQATAAAESKAAVAAAGGADLEGKLKAALADAEAARAKATRAKQEHAEFAHAELQTQQQLREEVARLSGETQRLSDVEAAWQQQCTKQGSELAKAKKEAAKLGALLQEAETKLGEAEARSSAAVAAATRAEEGHANHVRLQEELRHDSENLRLRASGLEEQVKVMEEHVTSTRGTLQQRDNELTAALQEADSQRKEKEEALTMAEVADRKREETARELQRVGQHLEDLQKLNAHLVASQDQAKATLVTHQQQLLELQHKSQEWTVEKAGAQEKMTSLHTQCQALQQALESRQEMYDQTKAEQTKLQSQLSDQQLSVKQLSEQLESAHQALRGAEARHSQSADSHVTHLQQLQQQLHASQERAQQVEAQLQDAMSECARLRNTWEEAQASSSGRELELTKKLADLEARFADANEKEAQARLAEESHRQMLHTRSDEARAQAAEQQQQLQKLLEEHRLECAGLRQAADDAAQASAAAEKARVLADKQVQETRQQLQDSWVELKPAQAQLAEAKQQIENMTEDAQQREARVGQLQLELARAEERCIALRAEADTARDGARAAKEVQATADNALGANARLEKQLQEATVKESTLVRALEQQRLESGELRAAVEKLQKDLVKLTAGRDAETQLREEATQQLQEVTEKLQSTSKANTELEAYRNQTSSLVSELEAQIAKLKKTNGKLEDSLAHSRESVKQLSADVKQAWGEVTNLRDTCKQQSVARVALVEKLDAAREHRDAAEQRAVEAAATVAQVEESKAVLEAELQQMKEQFASLQQCRAASREELAAADERAVAATAAVADAERRAATVEARSVTVSNQCNQLKSQIEQLKANQEDGARLKSHIAGLQEQVARGAELEKQSEFWRSKAQALESQVGAKEAEVGRVAAQLEEAFAAKEELQKEVLKARGDLQDSQAQEKAQGELVEATRMQLNELRQQLEAAKLREETLQAQQVALETIQNQANSSADQAKLSVEVAQRQLESHKIRASKLVEEVEGLQRKVLDREGAVERLQVKLAAANDQLQAKNQGAHAEVERLQREVAHKEAIAQQASEGVQKKTEELQQLSTDHLQLDNERQRLSLQVQEFAQQVQQLQQQLLEASRKAANVDEVDAARRAQYDAEQRTTAAESRAHAAESFARQLHLAATELTRVYEENDLLQTRVTQIEEDLRLANSIGHANNRQKVQYTQRVKQQLEDMRKDATSIMKDNKQLEQCLKFLYMVALQLRPDLTNGEANTFLLQSSAEDVLMGDDSNKENVAQNRQPNAAMVNAQVAEQLRRFAMTTVEERVVRRIEKACKDLNGTVNIKKPPSPSRRSPAKSVTQDVARQLDMSAAS